MGESSIIKFSVSLLAFLGVSGPVKEGYIQSQSELLSSTSTVDKETWTRVDFAESVLEHLRDNCNRTFLPETTSGNKERLLVRLYIERNKCLPGYRAITKLPEGQRTSLIELYKVLEKEEEKEEGKTESTDYRHDVDDYLDYRRLSLSMDLLRHNDQSSEVNNELFSSEQHRQGLRSPSSLERELYSLPQLKDAVSSTE